jgi:hypothetical protein
VIDISNPFLCFLLGTLPATDARGVAVSGSHAYLADYGSGLRVIDLLP